MSITVTPVTPDFVAAISGLVLARSLAPADRNAVEAAINRYAICRRGDLVIGDNRCTMHRARTSGSSLCAASPRPSSKRPRSAT